MELCNAVLTYTLHPLSAALKYSGLTEAYRTPFPSRSLFLTKTKMTVFTHIAHTASVLGHIHSTCMHTFGICLVYNHTHHITVSTSKAYWRNTQIYLFESGFGAIQDIVLRFKLELLPWCCLLPHTSHVPVYICDCPDLWNIYSCWQSISSHGAICCNQHMNYRVMAVDVKFEEIPIKHSWDG